MKAFCWSCKKELPSFDRGIVPFRETCDHCGADLHVCKGCAYYSPGRANDCQIPGTEFVRDREKRNLCEEFKLLEGVPPKSRSNQPSKEDIERRLFG